jgi:hypothetical protein
MAGALFIHIILIAGLQLARLILSVASNGSQAPFRHICHWRVEKHKSQTGTLYSSFHFLHLKMSLVIFPPPAKL